MQKKFWNFKKFEPPSMAPPLEVYWKKAKDVYVWDKSGKKYIDFTSTIFVTNIGHSNEKFKSKIKEVLSSPLSHSYTYYNKFREEYNYKLINFINKKNLNKCFFMSSGTESTEAALKLIRLNGLNKNKRKCGIICISGNWHGRTMGAQLLSDNKSQSRWITSKDKNIFHIDFPYPWKKDYNKKNFFEDSIKKKFPKNYDFKNKIAGVGSLFLSKRLYKKFS